MYRNTYVNINLDNIEHNVRKFIKDNNKYKYYFVVVKADSYGHYDNEVVNSIIEGGCNYLAVSSLDEAIAIRKYNKEIPILCLGIIDKKYIDVCIENNITITISSLYYLQSILKNNIKGLKVHIKINSGMNRLGINNKDEFNTAYTLIKNSNIYLEGLFTHMYDAMNKNIINKQYEKFENITSDINYNNIEIIHLCASDATLQNKKRDYENGCRLGIVMYGLTDTIDNEYLPTFNLKSEVIQINNLKKGDILGYGGKYVADKDLKIAVIPIGYADGIIRKNTGRYVYINDKKYNIVGNICMDMLFVLIDDTVKVGDMCDLIKDIDHIRYIAKYLDTITYEVICNIGKRVKRIYIKNNLSI